jgi:S1-C subfamily serine protease
MLAVLGFDLLDGLIALVVAIAIYRGIRVGFAEQAFSYAGFWGGLLGGAALSPLATSEVHGFVAKAIVALACAFGLAIVGGAIGRFAGTIVWRALRRVHLGPLDALLGGVFGAVATLLAVWLVANVLADVPLTPLASQIQRSKIVAALDKQLPPLPNFVSEVQRFAAASGFPPAFASLAPLPGTPVAEATRAQVAEAVRIAGPSLVKVEGAGCGELIEGSGFAVAPDLVVTNAHVVAGVPHPSVIERDGTRLAARAIFFDPRFDLAVLRVAGLDEPALHFDPAPVGRGTVAVVLGYPGGGPFTAVPAGVAARFSAVGRDIYGQGTTVRPVYEIDADVIPGNSGGPLVTPSGAVLGVVFSKSVTEPDVGFALAASGVVTRVEQAEAHPGNPGTGACIG